MVAPAAAPRKPNPQAGTEDRAAAPARVGRPPQSPVGAGSGVSSSPLGVG
jgi:hypothetical protein